MEVSKNAKNNLRNNPQAQISYFKQIINHRNLIHNYKTQNEPKQIADLFAVSSRIDPVFDVIYLLVPMGIMGHPFTHEYPCTIQGYPWIDHGYPWIIIGLQWISRQSMGIPGPWAL